MPNTPKGLTYPSNSSPVAVPADLQELATDVDGLIVPNTGGTYTGSVSFTQSPSVPTPTSGLHAVNKTYADAINTDVTALETELGSNPSGTFSTVVQRLDSYTDGFNKVGNLLTANQASVATTGLFTIDSCTEGAAGVFTATGSGALSAYLTVSGITVGEAYTLRSNLAPVGRTGWVILQFRNSGGALISGGSFTGNTVAAGTSGESRITAVAPAGTVTIRAYVAYSGTGATSDTVTATNIGLWKGAGGTWQPPGVPIPGQSRIAVNNAVDLSGTGTPEGVVTAAPGSTWLQTDSTTDVKGWIKWVKATGTGNTGWQAGAEADTGWRAITPNGSGWGSAGAIYIRRRGNTVEWALDSLGTTGTSGTIDTALATTSGWRPKHYGFGGYRNLGTGVYGSLIYNGGNLSMSVAPASGHTVIGSLVVTTRDAWPSSLPGSAA